MATSYLDDKVAISVRGTAGNWTNQATVYGVENGNSRLDGVSIAPKGAKALRGRIRPSIETGDGDDNVSIDVVAVNNGADFSNPNSSAASGGKQRAVGLNRTYIDLGNGNDDLSLNSKVEITTNWRSEFVQGASHIKNLRFFDGEQYTTKNALAAASVDLHETGVDAGNGNDEISFFNGWSSDIWLGDGDDSITLTAGKKLYIHGGSGSDKVAFSQSNATYEGLNNGFHEVLTSEGSVYLNSDIESISIDGDEVFNEPEPGPGTGTGTGTGNGTGTGTGSTEYLKLETLASTIQAEIPDQVVLMRSFSTMLTAIP